MFWNGDCHFSAMELDCYLTANLRPAVTSTHFHYVSLNPWQHLLFVEPAFWIFLYAITAELCGDVSSQVTYWHCRTNKGCSSRNPCTCHWEKLIWVKNFPSKNDEIGPTMQFTLYLCQIRGVIEQETQVWE